MRFLIVVGVLLATAGAVAADVQIEPPDAASDYARGKRLMREGDFLSAVQVFERLAGQYPSSPSLPLFVFHRAKASYYAGQHAKAVAGFSFFLSKFPDAPERPYAQYYLGNSYYRQGDVDRALRQYLLAYENAPDDRLARLARESVVALLENAEAVSVGPADFENLPPGRRCPLVKDVAQVLLDYGQVQVARELLASCGEAVDEAVIEDARRRSGRSTLEVAIMLPLSGELAEFGTEIYNGAVIAADLYREEARRKLVVVPYDTKGYPIDAARIVSELTLNPVDAAIGPLTSEAAAVASARLHGSELPLVIPAATEAGLTRLSETSFQLSPNVELQAVRLADYAVDVLGADTAAIIAPTTAEHLRLAETFQNRFEQRGGTVLAQEFYRARDRDFGPYVLDIKAELLGFIKDSSFYLDQRGDTIDIDGLPVNVDCLFLPGRSEQIRLLLPQIHFYNLTGQYLGTDGWGDEDIYRLGDDVTKEAIFTSPFLPVAPTDASVAFAAAYDSRYASQPGRLAKLGYDAMRLLLEASAGASSREEIVAALRTVRDYEGASGRVTFGEHRENVNLPLYRIVGGSPVPLAREPEPAPQ